MPTRSSRRTEDRAGRRGAGLGCAPVCRPGAGEGPEDRAGCRDEEREALKYADPELKKAREIVMEAVKKDPEWQALWSPDADSELKNDKRTGVLAAVKQNGLGPP